MSITVKSNYKLEGEDGTDVVYDGVCFTAFIRSAPVGIVSPRPFGRMLGTRPIEAALESRAAGGRNHRVHIGGRVKFPALLQAAALFVEYLYNQVPLADTKVFVLAMPSRTLTIWEKSALALLRQVELL